MSETRVSIGTMTLAGCLVLVGCSKPAPVVTSSAAPHNAPDASISTTTTAPDAGIATTTAATGPRRCIVDPAAEKACVAKGSGFSYAAPPFIYCSGVAANTRALAEQHARAHETQPCVCNDHAAIQREVAQCSMVPSAPGR